MIKYDANADGMEEGRARGEVWGTREGWGLGDMQDFKVFQSFQVKNALKKSEYNIFKTNHVSRDKNIINES